jgi:hypothetical protein
MTVRANNRPSRHHQQAKKRKSPSKVKPSKEVELKEAEPSRPALPRVRSIYLVPGQLLFYGWKTRKRKRHKRAKALWRYEIILYRNLILSNLKRFKNILKELGFGFNYPVLDRRTKGPTNYCWYRLLRNRKPLWDLQVAIKDASSQKWKEMSLREACGFITWVDRNQP